LRRRGRRPQAVGWLDHQDWQAARSLVGRLGEGLGPLAELLGSSAEADLATLVAAHGAAAEALGRGEGGAQAAPCAWDGGEVAAKFLTTLRSEGVSAPFMRPADYPAFYRSLAEDVTVRLRAPTHPRIFIWEPYESRLQHADVVVLGSLNEGTWPQIPDP